MRANKHAICWSLGITIISLIIALVLHGSKSFLYDISLACFGSSLITVVIAFTAYNAERRETMEQFLNESAKVIQQLKKIPHFKINEPMELVKNVLSEVSYFGSDHKYRDQLNEWIEPQILIDEHTSSEITDEMISRKADEIIEDAKKQLIKVVDAYATFSETDLSGLSNAYGKMDFLIANESIRKDAYTKIYDKIRNLKVKCIEESYHFILLKNGGGHIGVCFDKVVELDKLLYKTDTEDGWEVVFANMVNDLLHDLETLRAQIYRIKPEYDKPVPIEAYMHFDDSEQMQLLEERQKNRLREGVMEKAEKIKVVN